MAPNLTAGEVDTRISWADGASPTKACWWVALLTLAAALAGCGVSQQPTTPSSSPCAAMCLEPISVRPLDPVPPIIVRPLFSVHRPPPAPHLTHKRHRSAPTVHQ
jgi:hypothetical protein